MPMPFELDGRPHSRGYWQEIAGKAFYDALRNGGVAKTSQINPDTFTKIFLEYVGRGESALFLLLSSGLSNTLASARIALQELEETRPDCGIFIVDTVSATVGHGLLAMLAVKKRAEGLSAAETAAWLEVRKHSLIGVFTVDDLMYLHRGGRLSKLSAIAGSVLGIKPLLNFAPDGTLGLKDKARSRKAALELMVSQLRRSIRPDTVLEDVLISHTDSPEDAQKLAAMVEDAVNVRRVTVMMMGPVIGAHLGPGAVTLVFAADMTRGEYEERFYK